MEQKQPALLRIARRAADRLRGGHLWVYRGDIESDTSGIGAGALVSVVDGRGIPLGTALYSSASQIAARLVSRAPVLSRAEYLRNLRDRLASAVDLRKQLAPVTAANDAHRIVFSEADDLPGIVIDRYNDLIVLQLLTQGTAQDDVRETIVDVFRNTYAGLPITLWERPDPRIRELEQLPAAASEPLFSAVEPRCSTQFHLNSLTFGYDAGAGQKTGAFLDQRLNYAAAAQAVQNSGLTKGALDVCTYQGGFALHLAQVCDRVTGVDASRSALEAADRNLERNPGLRAKTDWIEADAFDLLRAYGDAGRKEEGRRYDAIVLDPPAFAKSKRVAEGALRGYKELNLQGMRMLRAGGTLVTCSCSHHIHLEDFTAIVAAAAADAGRRVQLLEVRGAAPDHPEILTLTETRYLKCLIARVG